MPADRPNGSLPAAFLLLATSVAWAATPLLVSLLDGQRNPVGYTLGYELSSVAAVFFYGRRQDPLFCSPARLKRYLPKRATFWRNISEMGDWYPDDVPLVSWQTALSLLTPLTLLCYTYSVRLIPSVVAAVLLESWPMLFFVLHRKMIPQHQQMNAAAVPLFVLILCGAAGVIFSPTQTGDSQTLGGLLGWETVAGSAMMAAATVLLAVGAFRLAVADLVAGTDKKKAVVLLEYNFVTQIVGMALIAVLIPALGTPDMQLAALVFLAGLPVLMLGNATNAHATARMAQHPKLIALRYTTPAFSVLLLWAVGDYAGVNTLTLLLGMALIVVGNAMLNITDRQQTEQPTFCDD